MIQSGPDLKFLTMSMILMKVPMIKARKPELKIKTFLIDLKQNFVLESVFQCNAVSIKAGTMRERVETVRHDITDTKRSIQGTIAAIPTGN